MAVKPFDVWKLREPTEGPICVCKCGARYRPFPKQSHRICRYCQPPGQICRHLTIVDFFDCAACFKVTGQKGKYLGLERIKVSK